MMNRLILHVCSLHRYRPRPTPANPIPALLFHPSSQFQSHDWPLLDIFASSSLRAFGGMASSSARLRTPQLSSCDAISGLTLSRLARLTDFIASCTFSASAPSGWLKPVDEGSVDDESVDSARVLAAPIPAKPTPANRYPLYSSIHPANSSPMIGHCWTFSLRVLCERLAAWLRAPQDCELPNSRAVTPSRGSRYQGWRD